MPDPDPTTPSPTTGQGASSSKVEMSQSKILGLLAYYCILSIVLIYMLAAIWPTPTTSPAEAESEAESAEATNVTFFGLKTSISEEVRLIIIVVLAGGLGATIHGLSSLAIYKARGKLTENWTLWYFSRPFIGGSLALVLYLVVRGGLLTGFESLNIHGIAGLAGLSGMFTYHATVKLRDVLDVLFGTQKDEKV